MCDSSKRHLARRFKIGQTARVRKIPISGGEFEKVAVPIAGELGVECLCLKNGDRLVVSRLSKRFLFWNGLTKGEVTARFIAAFHGYNFTDHLQFSNGRTVTFDSLTVGARIERVAPKQHWNIVIAEAMRKAEQASQVVSARAKRVGIVKHNSHRMAGRRVLPPWFRGGIRPVTFAAARR